MTSGTIHVVCGVARRGVKTSSASLSRFTLSVRCLPSTPVASILPTSAALAFNLGFGLAFGVDRARGRGGAFGAGCDRGGGGALLACTGDTAGSLGAARAGHAQRMLSSLSRDMRGLDTNWTSPMTPTGPKATTSIAAHAHSSTQGDNNVLHGT